MAVLKSITIDGTQMDNTANQGLYSKTISLPSGVNTLVTFDELVFSGSARYSINCLAQFSANANGYRQVRGVRINSSEQETTMGNIKVAAANAGMTILPIVWNNQRSAGTNIGLYVMQNSGQTLDVTISCHLVYCG